MQEKQAARGRTNREGGDGVGSVGRTLGNDESIGVGGLWRHFLGVDRGLPSARKVGMGLARGA